MISLIAAIAFAPAVQVGGVVHLSNGRPAAQATVWLEGSIHSKPLAKAIVDQRDRSFVPHVSIVTVGTEIQFPNNDTIFHNVFAEFDAKRFDLGMYPRGKSKYQRFDKPGLVALLCSVHSEMSAYVMVVDTPFYAVTNRKGAFTIPEVAPGDYVVKTWHESGEKSATAIHVGGAREDLDLKTARK